MAPDLGIPNGAWNLLGSFTFLQTTANPGGFITPSIIQLNSAPFASIASSIGLVMLTYVLFADAYVSPSGTLNVYLGTSMRTLYGTAALGYLPESMMKVDEKRRQKLIVELGDVVSREHFVELFNITKAIKIDDGEIYTPSKETLAEAERMHRLRQIAIEAAEQGGKSSSDKNDKRSGKGDSRGSGRGYGKS